jgi:hypothetical protein
MANSEPVNERMDPARQLWENHPTDFGLTSHEGRLLLTLEVAPSDRLLLSAWSGMVCRSALETAGNSSVVPFLFAYLTDDLLPMGWTKEEAYEELAFETRLNEDQLRSGLERLYELLRRISLGEKALEALGWVLKGEYPEGASWLVLCWDAFLSPSERIIARSDAQQLAENMPKLESNDEEIETPLLDEDDIAENAVSGDDSKEWQEFLTFLAGRIADHEDVSSDSPSDRSTLRRRLG